MGGWSRLWVNNVLNLPYQIGKYKASLLNLVNPKGGSFSYSSILMDVMISLRSGKVNTRVGENDVNVCPSPIFPTSLFLSMCFS